jgi:hypothetical protein
VAPELVARFREREESVKATVMAAYCDLVRQVRGRWAGNFEILNLFGFVLKTEVGM